MKLQKLIYYAHAFHLVNFKEKLIDENLQAWIYGPVFTKLYQEFCKHSYHALKKTSKGNDNKLLPNQKETINLVIEKFGNMDGGDLSEQTYKGKPWLNSFNKSCDWEQNVITDKDLIKYFSKKNINNVI
ncbi:MAG: hypothetical protein WJU30_00441 [Candidatus Phytoplasma pruni]